MKNNVRNIIRHVFMKMAIVCVFSGLAILQSYAAHSQTTATLTLDLENVTLKQVFESIENQTDYFFYYTEHAAVDKRVSVKAVNQTVEEVLAKILPTGHSYRLNGRQIAIVANQESLRVQDPVQVITGRVTDTKGNPMPGVAVVLQGTPQGTVTDVTGNYTLRILENTSPNANITFSFLGMKGQTVRLQGRSQINIVMEEDATDIEDVVITGIANINRLDFVGASQTIKGVDIYNPAETTIEGMLEGQIAGLQVIPTTNKAGSSPQIRLRGQSTLLGTTSPLWVIDGVIQSDMPSVDGLAEVWNSGDLEINEIIGGAISWLNPMDIETITVLKDASATAIYGSRASNGVIVITTKRGGNTDGRPSISVSGNWSLGQRPNYSHYNLMNSQERISFSREALESGAYYYETPKAQLYTYEGLYSMYLQGMINEESFRDQYSYLETNNTNWLKMLMRTSVTQSYNISMNGGGEKSRYNVSASYSKVDGMEKGNGTDRITARMSYDLDLTSKLKLNITLSGGHYQSTGFAGGVSPLTYALNTSRAIPAYDQAGDPVWYTTTDTYRYNGDTKETGLLYNFENDLDNVGSKVWNPYMQANVDLKYQILPELSYQVVGGFDIKSQKSEQWLEEDSYFIYQTYRGYLLNSADAQNEDYTNAALLKRGGMLTTNDSYQRAWSIRNQLNFIKQFNDDHRMTLVGAWEVSSTYNNSKYNTVWGYMRNRGEVLADPTLYDQLIPHNPDSSTSVTDMLSTWGKLSKGAWRSRNYESNKMSVVMMGTYSFKNRYVFNANFRNDWSNSFGQDANNRFVPSYSFGVSWRVLAEPFMQDKLKWLDALTPRVTYGTQGNDLAQQPEMILSALGIHALYDEFYSYIVKLATPDLRWERTETWNFGLDLSALKGLVTLSLDGYTRKSDVGRSMTMTTEYGGYSATINGSIIRNTGIEALLNVVAFRNQDWNVSIGLNAARNWNKILKIRQEVGAANNYTNYVSGTTSLAVAEGYPLGSLWAYSFAGLDDTNGLPTFNNLDNENIESPSDYLVYMGSSLHYLSGGMNIKVSYKNFSVRAQFTANIGGKGFLPNPYSSFVFGRIPNPTANLSKELNDRWRQPGDQATIPGLYTYSTLDNIYVLEPSTGLNRSIYDVWAQSDVRVASKSSFKCSQVMFTYRLPEEKTKAIGLKGVSFTGAINNLFMIADKKWNGMDPDMGGIERRPLGGTLGVSLSF